MPGKRVGSHGESQVTQAPHSDAIYLRPFRAFGYQFDQADVSPMLTVEQRREVQRKWSENLSRVIEQFRPVANICDTRKFYKTLSDDWKAHVCGEREIGHTDPDYAEFLSTRKPDMDAAYSDPRLQVITMGMRELQRSGQIVGGLRFYNVDIVESTELKVKATAYCAPGVPFDSEEEFKDLVSKVMRHYLDVDLPMFDGRSVDLGAWNFPTDDPTHRWEGSGLGEQLVTDSVGDGRIVELKGGAASLRRILK